MEPVSLPGGHRADHLPLHPAQPGHARVRGVAQLLPVLDYYAKVRSGIAAMVTDLNCGVSAQP